MNHRGYKVYSKEAIASMVGIKNLVHRVDFGIFNENNSRFDTDCGAIEVRWVDIGPFIVADIVCSMEGIVIFNQFLDLLRDWPRNLAASSPLSVAHFCEFLEDHGFKKIDNE